METEEMRQLTVKRRKRFVASLGTIIILAESPESGECVVNNKNCRVLGVLPNGGEITVEIGEEETVIYAVADMRNTDFCKELYRIPAGSEDIVLTGQNKLNPLNGNIFVFNGNESDEAREFRKKGSKKRAVTFIVSLVVFALIGGAIGYMSVTLGRNSSKTFEKDGFAITLTNRFGSYDFEGMYATYGSPDVSVYVIRDGFDMIGDLASADVDTYAENVIFLNNSDVTIEHRDGLTCFSYRSIASDSNEYQITVFAFKGSDAFWLIEFGVRTENAGKYDDFINEAAKSVRYPGCGD